MTEFAVNYSGVDKLVHRLAMSQLEMQKMLSRMEDRNFDKSAAAVTAADPVFITSLPRAGTTLLLEVLAGAPEFASHTYRNMPFLLCPLTWDKLSRSFHKEEEVRERAHGDGMLVGYDSVEAFEEVIWRAFWPEHFEKRRVVPWQPDEADLDGDFVPFLRQHMRKIIALKRARSGSDKARRYVSKNNANISRIAWLERHFPDATILVPYRNPVGHIASLLRQHKNFLQAHKDDRFILRYMESIGHLEFGEALRPIDFAGWLEESRLDPATEDFWAEYWIEAFQSVLQAAGPNTVILSYDRLCTEPERALKILEEILSAAPGSFTAAAGRFRAPTEAEPPALEPARAARLTELAAELDARSII